MNRKVRSLQHVTFINPCINFKLNLFHTKSVVEAVSVNLTANSATLHTAQFFRNYSPSVTQATSRLLRNPKVHYKAHNSPLLDPVLGQTNEVHICILHFIVIHF
jgi:hypothetical protein